MFMNIKRKGHTVVVSFLFFFTSSTFFLFSAPERPGDVSTESIGSGRMQGADRTPEQNILNAMRESILQDMTNFPFNYYQGLRSIEEALEDKIAHYYAHHWSDAPRTQGAGENADSDELLRLKIFKQLLRRPFPSLYSLPLWFEKKNRERYDNENLNILKEQLVDYYIHHFSKGGMSNTSSDVRGSVPLIATLIQNAQNTDDLLSIRRVGVEPVRRENVVALSDDTFASQIEEYIEQEVLPEVVRDIDYYRAEKAKEEALDENITTQMKRGALASLILGVLLLDTGRKHSIVRAGAARIQNMIKEAVKQAGKWFYSSLSDTSSHDIKNKKKRASSQKVRKKECERKSNERSTKNDQ